MNITINDDVCTKYGLSLPELLVVLALKSDKLETTIASLEKKGAIVSDVFEGYLVTQRWDDVASSILLDSDKDRQSPDRIANLAAKLMEIFPKEKKAGTNHYFRGNTKDVTLKLKKFFKLYGDKYSDEQVLNAAQAYVSSFNGNYTYMRILKYFLWKDDKKLGEDGKYYIEETSDLATWIENAGSTNNQNWEVELK
jgi:hypothetical protein